MILQTLLFPPFASRHRNRPPDLTLEAPATTGLSATERFQPRSGPLSDRHIPIPPVRRSVAHYKGR